MGGRHSRSELANYVDEHRNNSPSSRQSHIAANPNMRHRPLPEIPPSPAESVSTQLPPLAGVSPVSLSPPEIARTEHTDATSLPRIVVGVEHIYPRRRQHHHHHGASSHSGSSLESLLRIRGISRLKCPLCSKEMTSSELEQHIMVCLARPRALYNVDTLNFDAGECTICLDDMAAGDKIARLPCLCIYHVRCIEQWHKVNPTCPVHPESESSS
eukprot:Em0018g123a